MKFVAIALLAFAAAVSANPINVSGNNVGDIVTVGVNLNAVLSNSVDQNIVNVIAAILNQQAIAVGGGEEASQVPAVPEVPEVLSQMHITPEMIEKFTKLMKTN